MKLWLLPVAIGLESSEIFALCYDIPGVDVAIWFQNLPLDGSCGTATPVVGGRVRWNTDSL